MQKIKILILTAILIIFASVALDPTFILADSTINLNMPFDENKKTIEVTETTTSFDIVSKYVSMIYTWGAMVTGLLAVLMMVVGGVQYMLYGADPGQKDDAKERIQQALVALTLLLLSGLILKTINPNFFTF